MRKLAVILTLAIALIGCTKEESSDFYYLPEYPQPEKPIPNVDMIVGTWNTLMLDGIELDKCDQQDIYIFSNDHTYYRVDFSLIDGKCEIDPSYKYMGGTWKLIEEGVYLLQWTDNEGTQAITISGKFSDNNTVMAGDELKLVRY